MPKIQDIMDWRGKYKYFTKIDLSMFFYCFELDDESKELCIINTPYELFHYTRLAMGVKVSPDVAQEMITKMLNLFLTPLNCTRCDLILFSLDNFVFSLRLAIALCTERH